jgi:hypothetical protein
MNNVQDVYIYAETVLQVTLRRNLREICTLAEGESPDCVHSDQMVLGIVRRGG